MAAHERIDVEDEDAPAKRVRLSGNAPSVGQQLSATNRAVGGSTSIGDGYQRGSIRLPKSRVPNRNLCGDTVIKSKPSHRYGRANKSSGQPSSGAKRRKIGARPPRADEDFYRFMVRREEVRIRRHVKQLSAYEWCPMDGVMRTTCLTNVSREDDRTTIVLRRIARDAVDARWRENASAPAGHWSVQQRTLAGLLVFNYALWRAFGHHPFIAKLGFLDMHEWGDAQQEQVVLKAMEFWKSGGFCFTDAYAPPRTARGAEQSAYVRGGLEAVRRTYSKVCRELKHVWTHRLRLVRVAETTRSWEATTKALMGVHGYGGTGFLAKEVVQDLLHSPMFSEWDFEASKWHSVCTDTNLWCAIGPGARRGLNRLRGRPVDEHAYSNSAKRQVQFLADTLALFRRWREPGMWPETILEVPSVRLELHDIQFQLCEFDKYERVRLKEGTARIYRLPTGGV